MIVTALEPSHYIPPFRTFAATVSCRQPGNSEPGWDLRSNDWDRIYRLPGFT